MGKHPCQSLFINKVAGLSPATLFKKLTPTRVFFCELCEFFLQATISQNMKAKVKAKYESCSENA